MKRTVSVLLCLALLICAAAGMAEAEAQEEGFQWGAYMLRATWLTTDPSAINIPNLRDGGLFVMIRLEGVGTPVMTGDIQAIQAEEFVLADKEGNEYGISTWIVHQLIQPEGGGFPSMAPEQDSFDILFFLEGKGEEAAAGAQLRVGSSLIDLDSIPRELPSAEE